MNAVQMRYSGFWMLDSHHHYNRTSMIILYRPPRAGKLWAVLNKPPMTASPTHLSG